MIVYPTVLAYDIDARRLPLSPIRSAGQALTLRLRLPHVPWPRPAQRGPVTPSGHTA